jgi:hypothetical protein
MSTKLSPDADSESTLDHIYMPAAHMPETVSRVERFVTDLLSPHGRVLIPTDYWER